MGDSERLQAVVASAEQAAMAGDFSAAAQHLRDALALQEAELGPSHPDIASTLNNLGVVCERTGNDAEAERCYRRACEIVTSAFPPEHPFVETSRQNLAAFCESHHVPLEPVTVAPPKTTAAPKTAAPIESREPPAPAFTPEPLPRVVVASPPGRPDAGLRVWPIVVAGAAAVVVLLALWLRHSGRDDASTTSGAAPVTTPAPVSTPVVTPTPAPHPPTAVTTAPSKPAPPALASAPSRPAARGSGDAVVIIHAELCRTLTTGADWACAHPSDPVSPGAIYFYTRLTTPRDTTVVHRWYRNDRVQQSRELQIHANQGPGYRTYSRITIDPGESGNWRVELCTTDGRVLQEERFVVR